MEITDFGKSHWAIIQEKYDILAAQVDTLPTPDILADKMAGYMSKQANGPELDIRDGVAILGVTGSISQKETWLSYWFGGTGLNRLENDFKAAENDPAVAAIVLDVDSPGGTLPGLIRMAKLIKESSKPVVTYSASLIASAAYWIGCHASKIILSPTAEAGSIGILLVHTDFSAMDKDRGVKRTFLSAGKYKAVGNSAEPLSKESAAILQEELDYLYDIFTDTVATGRNTTQKEVLATMADGRIFIGQQAVDAGLADELGSLEDAIETAATLAQDSGSIYHKKSGQAGKEQAMDLQELKAKHPDLATALKQEGVDSVDVDTAVSAETDRLKGLATAKFGEEAGKTFAALVDTNVTVAQFQAIHGPAQPPADDKITDKTGEMLEEIKKAGAEDVGAGGGGKPSTKDYMALVAEYKATHKCTQFEALNAVAAASPEARDTYLKNAQAS